MKLSISNGNAGKFVLVFLLLLSLTPVFGQAEVKIKRTRAEYLENDQFYRISEFFTYRENTGGDLIVRTQDEDRSGYYFTIRLTSYPYQKEVVEEAVRLQVILPGDIEPTLFTFPLGPAKRKNPLLLIGLTGDDWPDPEARPLAWHLSFHDEKGTQLAEAQSFLWSIED
ncbi:MAG TPA: hypothetical protein VK041_08065 [Opitutales bacterium]|nr:hypothetical protein [Opitutales bacterium]